MKCPNCNEFCSRDSVDNGVALLYGPWGCECGWSEEEEYNQLTGPKYTKGIERKLDQWGRAHYIRDEDRYPDKLLPKSIDIDHVHIGQTFIDLDETTILTYHLKDGTMIQLESSINSVITMLGLSLNDCLRELDNNNDR